MNISLIKLLFINNICKNYIKCKLFNKFYLYVSKIICRKNIFFTINADWSDINQKYKD